MNIIWLLVESSSTIKGAVAILNCILARQLCFEDPSCSAILEIIPRVCGPIPAQYGNNNNNNNNGNSSSSNISKCHEIPFEYSNAPEN
ncbi:hypothetical protein AWZ03_003505 [Drosophila navojoa]|uniref:Uncharacterized protein n=1 Tax=Drosophila navojoa TaxID=7232 RepID=A0A484BQ32_DRONA|nr:hypothetical protein AWZ03_003505 [Drosophila navojoa]